jgi:hypothetical protein
VLPYCFEVTIEKFHGMFLVYSVLLVLVLVLVLSVA